MRAKNLIFKTAPILYPVKQWLWNSNSKCHHQLLKWRLMGLWSCRFWYNQCTWAGLVSNFPSGPISTEKHIDIYIHTSLIVDSQPELEEPQRPWTTMSSFYNLENPSSRRVACVSQATGRSTIENRIRLGAFVLCSSSVLHTLCTDTPSVQMYTGWHRGAACVQVHTLGARWSNRESPGAWAHVPGLLWDPSVNRASQWLLLLVSSSLYDPPPLWRELLISSNHVPPITPFLSFSTIPGGQLLWLPQTVYRGTRGPAKRSRPPKVYSEWWQQMWSWLPAS